MLKPYNFPVKRGAWRLITNKKNCNYWKKYIEVDKKPTTSYYEFLSSWADSKRRLSVSISYDSLLDFPTTAEEAGIDNNIVRITKDTETSLGKPKENVVMCVSKESGDIYKVYITYNCS